MKVIAVVVTHNRLSILKECVAAIIAQSRRPDVILVVNNASSDGTAEWLDANRQVVAIDQENMGGAGGFYTGIKEAYKMKAGWMWLMDDDTVPHADALEQLLNAANSMNDADDEFGFFASKVIWKDGEWHRMNKMEENDRFAGKRPADYYKQKGIIPIRVATFVSMLLSAKAVKKAGLPLKDFFIWHDDSEYTLRMGTFGLNGGLVEKSIVLHKTAENYKDDIYIDDVKNIWKYRHGLRNQLYTRRYEKSYGSFLRNVVKRSVIMPFKILFKRKKDRWPFIKVIWQSSWQALWFNPKKEYADE